MIMNREHRLPNLILGGPGRTGTTSLFEYLLQVSQICGSQKKETNFFLGPLYGRPLSPVVDYARLFDRCKERDYRYVVESTPSYFLGGRKIAEAMSAVLGDFKIVFTLREPVERFISGYWHVKSKVLPGENMSIEEYLDRAIDMPIEKIREYNDISYAILGEGSYVDHLEQWYETVGPEAIHIIFYENMLSDIDDTLQGLLQWLELEVDDAITFPYTNKSISLRSSTLQKIAGMLNRAGEPFLRKNQRIKNIMGSLYYLINAKKERETCPSKVRKYLEGHYEVPNKRLSAFLRQNGITNLPQWIVNA
jgi:hypothetical protein